MGRAKKNKYEGLPKVTYSEGKRREVTRRLRMRAAGDAEFTDRVILQQYGLDPKVPLADYLRVWSVSTGEDLMHLAGGEIAPLSAKAPRKARPAPIEKTTVPVEEAPREATIE
jgi:hypothetical protein